ncbi:hypothetical protein [Nocardia sp. NPDC052566]|uniref:hypothetical protein n=1 Tax=Nocardia sp. NPDC052566 TaxID=3364330 RepID=UPI0037C66C9A
MTLAPFADPDRLPELGRKAALEVVRELAGAAKCVRTGILRVSGDPGGDFHMVGGRIAAVHSPGAPGISELLARPGRGSTGDAEFRVLEMMAAMDGAFAIVAGWIADCRWSEVLDPDEPGGPPIGTARGVEPDWLLAETERRLRVVTLARVSPHRNRLMLTDRGRTLLGSTVGERQAILRQIDGSHCCRDIAFRLNRGLYAVTVEVARLLAEDVLVVPPPHLAQPTEDGRDALPRRRRGASGINDMIPPRPPQVVLRAPPLITPPPGRQ